MSAAGEEVPPDVNRGGQILAICGTLTALCLLIVVLRIWVRARIIRLVGPDDWIMIAAMVCLTCIRDLPIKVDLVDDR
jgi:hypothetical protein